MSNAVSISVQVAINCRAYSCESTWKEDHSENCEGMYRSAVLRHLVGRLECNETVALRDHVKHLFSC